MRRGALAPALTLCVLVAYLLTLCPTVHWLDSGELITGAFHLGVPHPPGEPYWVLLAHGAALLPLGDVPLRVGALSALAGAAVLPAAMLAATTWGRWRWGRRGSLSLALCIASGCLTYPLWIQAVRAEVYSLQLALTLMCVAVLGLASRQRPRPWMLAALLGGLSASVHPLLAAAALGPLIGWVALTRGIPRGPALIATAGMALLGLSPYLLLPLRAHAGALYVWGDPTTASGMVDVLLARSFHHNFQEVEGASTLHNLGQILKAVLHGANEPVLTLAAIGALLGLWRSPRAMIGALLVIGGTLWTILPQNKVFVENPDLHGYLAIVSVGVWTLMGLALVWAGNRPLPGSGNPLPAMLPLLAVVVFGGGAALAQRPLAERSSNDLARQHSLMGLAATPPGGVLVTSGNNTMFGVMYLQWVEGWRPDVRAIHRSLVGHPWYQRSWERAPRPTSAPELGLSQRPPDELAQLGAGVVVEAREQDVAQATLLCPVGGDGGWGYYRVISAATCELPLERPRALGLAARWKGDPHDLEARQVWYYAMSLQGDYWAARGRRSWKVDPWILLDP